MSQARLTAMLFNSLVKEPLEEDVVPAQTCITPPTEQPTTPTHAHQKINMIPEMILVGAKLAVIQIRDEYMAVPCKKYWESDWLDFDECLPSPDEVIILERLTTLIRAMWPAVDIDDFKLSILKFNTRNVRNEPEDSELWEQSSQYFCQAALGVAAADDKGQVSYDDILIGPKVARDPHDGKKPEYEHERRAMFAMVHSAFVALQHMTPVRRKRMAEETYEGSSVPAKRSRTGSDASSPIELE